MKTYEELYSIFRECFPELTASYDNFVRLLAPDECTVITRTECGHITGFAAVHNEHIRLICVRPQYRSRGIGSGILKECEDIIRSSGYDKAVLGDDNWLFLGAVLSGDEWNRHCSDYFGSHGYNIHHGCAEMSMESSLLDESLIPVPAVDAEFRFVRSDEHEKLIRAVAMVEEDWCQYFTEDESVFAAFVGDEIASFCIAEEHCTTMLSSESANIGSVGCVGTVPHMRRNSLGLAMVGKASAYLRDKGCDRIYIHYTALVDWYSRLGFSSFIYFGFGEKRFE